MIARRLVVCAFVSAVLVIGCGSAASPTPTRTIEPSAGPTGIASPAASPGASITTLGSGTASLDPATYRLALATAPTVLDPKFPSVLMTVPAGWGNLNGWGMHQGSIDDTTAAVQFWNVDQVYGHPCKWSGTLSRPGPAVDDLVKALVDRPLRNATQPTDVTLDGYSAKYLEWSVPADADFSTCDADAGMHYFESWTAHGGDGDRYHQGPGKIDRLWILDVNGARVVIDAFSMPSATSEERDELLAVVKSINFER